MPIRDGFPPGTIISGELSTFLGGYTIKEKDEPIQQGNWITPSFSNIKKKKTKRISPSLDTLL